MDSIDHFLNFLADLPKDFELYEAERLVRLEERKMQLHLKVKVASLAAEARIIRKLELRLKRKGVRGDHPSRMSLSSHRRFVVRRECRLSHLAYGFLRGRPYKAMEAKTHDPLTKADWDRVAKMVEKYGSGDPRASMQKFEEWKTV